jgi:hypothetical protein
LALYALAACASMRGAHERLEGLIGEIGGERFALRRRLTSITKRP